MYIYIHMYRTSIPTPKKLETPAQSLRLRSRPSLEVEQNEPGEVGLGLRVFKGSLGFLQGV